MKRPKTEAGRCLQCECLICVRECLYMQKYKGYPRVYARQMYNNAAIVKGHHQANTMINSCTLCGQCEVLCPEGFSMADLCLSFREDMVRRGMMPPSAHEFALEDMSAANGPECALSFAGSGADGKAAERCGHVFFPGCQLAGARGEQVLAVYETLRKNLGQRRPVVAMLRRSRAVGRRGKTVCGNRGGAQVHMGIARASSRDRRLRLMLQDAA